MVLVELEKQLKVLEKCFKEYKPEKVEKSYMCLKNERKNFVESVVLEQSSFVDIWMYEYPIKLENNEYAAKAYKFCTPSQLYAQLHNSVRLWSSAEGGHRSEHGERGC